MLRKLSIALVAPLALGLGLSSAVMAGPTSAVCENENVNGLGGFNAEAICPSGHYATGGGYQVTSKATGDLLGISVSESMVTFSGTTPHGWEVVGTNNTTIPGTIRVCVICN